jgi:hypothetical protein
LLESVPPTRYLRLRRENIVLYRYSSTVVIPPIEDALSRDNWPDDIAESIQHELRIFRENGSSFGIWKVPPGIQGSGRYAELVLQLAYWLAIGPLTVDGFRILKSRIPPTLATEGNVQTNDWWAYSVEAPGYTYETIAPPDMDLGPVLTHDGADMFEMYLSNGIKLSGPVVFRPKIRMSQQFTVVDVTPLVSQRRGCLLGLALTPLALTAKFLARLFML